MFKKLIFFAFTFVIRHRNVLLKYLIFRTEQSAVETKLEKKNELKNHPVGTYIYLPCPQLIYM